uniref:(northern house mosquito) hypothetical protein n=1 Tax=Culex pipiens TaxID=7175 RepID=A0A8D8KKA4_CULPI
MASFISATYSSYLSRSLNQATYSESLKMTSEDSLNFLPPSQVTASSTSSLISMLSAFITMFSSHSSLILVRYSNSLLYRLSSLQMPLFSSISSLRVRSGNLNVGSCTTFMQLDSAAIRPSPAAAGFVTTPEAPGVSCLRAASRLKLCSATTFSSSSMLDNFFKISLMSSDWEDAGCWSCCC